MWASVKSVFGEIKGHGRRGQLQFRCFMLTFLAHGLSYFLRKGLAVIKHDLSNDLNISLPFLGWLDTSFLLPTAIIQIFFVQSALRHGPRKVISYSLILTAIALATFGWWNSYLVFLVLLFFGGSFQALIFPYCITALSAWYPGRGKSSIFGLWGTCVFLGGILGTLVSVEARIMFGWEYVFLIASIMVGLVGVPMLRFLRMPSGTTLKPLLHVGGAAGKPAGAEASTATSPTAPRQAEVVMRAEAFSQTDRAMTAEEEQAVVSSGVYVIDSAPPTRTLKVSEVAKIEMVKEVAAAYFCVNVIRFCAYMWLPLFLERMLDHPRGTAGFLPLMFEVGGLLGSPTLGLLADCAVCCGLFYVTVGWGVIFNALFLFLAGAGNGGTDLILAGTVAVDLGEAEGEQVSHEHADSADCISSVTGFVSGFGVLGAVVQGPMVAFAVHHYGEKGIFAVLTLFALTPILAVARTLKLDERTTKSRQEVSEVKPVLKHL